MAGGQQAVGALAGPQAPVVLPAEELLGAIRVAVRAAKAARVRAVRLARAVTLARAAQARRVEVSQLVVQVQALTEEPAAGPAPHRTPPL